MKNHDDKGGHKPNSRSGKDAKGKMLGQDREILPYLDSLYWCFGRNVEEICPLFSERSQS